MGNRIKITCDSLNEKDKKSFRESILSIIALIALIVALIYVNDFAAPTLSPGTGQEWKLSKSLGDADHIRPPNECDLPTVIKLSLKSFDFKVFGFGLEKVEFDLGLEWNDSRLEFCQDFSRNGTKTKIYNLKFHVMMCNILIGHFPSFININQISPSLSVWTPNVMTTPGGFAPQSAAVFLWSNGKV
jgi:hypothetical protein